MGSDSRPLRILLLLAIPGVVLLGIGTLVTWRSEQDRFEAERVRSRRAQLEDAAARLTELARRDLVRASELGAVAQDTFGLAGPDRPLLVRFDNGRHLVWPERAPMVRREDVRRLLAPEDAGFFDVLVRTLSDGGSSPASQSLLASACDSSAEPLALFARFYRLSAVLDASGLSTDIQEVAAKEMLAAPASQQVSGHRQWLRGLLLDLAVRRADRVAVDALMNQSTRELSSLGLTELSVAEAWLADLRARCGEFRPSAGAGTRLSESLASTVRRLLWLPAEISTHDDVVVGAGRDLLVRTWEDGDAAVRGVEVVLPPERPSLPPDVDSSKFELHPIGVGGGSASSVRLHPFFPAHELVALESADVDLMPWRTVLTAGFLVSGLLVATLGVLASFRGVASREQDLAERAELLASLSHQLKTPAANVRMFAETLRTVSLQAAERAKMERILHDEALRLQGVLDRVLAFQSATERREVALEPLDLRALLIGRAECWAATASQRGARFELTAGDHQVLVLGDERGLLDALDNLIDNAVSALAPGGRARVRLHEGEAEVRVEIEDDGHGIAEEDRRHVFERFYRGRTRRARAGQGSGLGLAIVAAVAERHGGRAGIRRTGPEGTTMELVLRKAH